MLELVANLWRKAKIWSERQDSNLRPLVPQTRNIMQVIDIAYDCTRFVLRTFTFDSRRLVADLWHNRVLA